MAQTLLINPRKRRKARRSNPSPAQRRARAAFAAMSRARSGAARKANPKRRRRNPTNYAPVLYSSNPRRRARRRNPVGMLMRRRRRNPISLGGSSLSVNSIMGLVKEGAIMGVGAVAMDWGYAQFSRYLPASMQAGPGQITAGTAVKAALTAALGIALNRATKGLSKKAALGALVVQSRDVALTYMPASVAGTVAGLGYMSPAPTFNRNLRINAAGNLRAYVPGMRSPALQGVGAYVPMRSPVLQGMGRR